MNLQNFSKPLPLEGSLLVPTNPIGDVCQTGTPWHLPNCAVEYPLSFSVIANGAFVFGRSEPLPVEVAGPGDAAHADGVVVAAGQQRLTRRRAQRAVVWKRLKRSPLLRQPFGCRRTARSAERAAGTEADVVEEDDQHVFGATAGGRSGSIGGQGGPGSLASYVVNPRRSIRIGNMLASVPVRVIRFLR